MSLVCTGGALWICHRGGEPCHMYQWIMQHVRMSHVTYMNDACHIHEGVMWRIRTSDVAHMNDSRRINQCFTSHMSCDRYQWFMSHTWMSHNAHIKESCDTYQRVNVTHMNASCDTWTGHITEINRSCHRLEWVMSDVRMRHVTRINETCRTYEWGMSHVWMRHVTRKNDSFHTYTLL